MSVGRIINPATRLANFPAKKKSQPADVGVNRADQFSICFRQPFKGGGGGGGLIDRSVK